MFDRYEAISISSKLEKIFFAFLMLLSQVVYSGEYLYRFNGEQSQGKSLIGWEFKDDVTGYKNIGWQYTGSGIDRDIYTGGPVKFSWGVGPRMFNKGDYGRENSALIDHLNRAPSTSEGGSLKIFDLPSAEENRNQATWWIWYDGMPLSKRNITDGSTNRFEFYVRLEGLKEISEAEGVQDIYTNFHIGTYLCWYREDGKSAYGRGDGCPYEGVGNQHYYHYFTFYPGAWIKVMVDQHPQHLRKGGSYKITGNNPSFINHGKNYFEHINQMYLEIIKGQEQKTVMHVDEMYFYEDPEPQNERSVNSVWVGYWESENMWRVGFHDMSGSCGECVKTYEIKWSDKPITNSNYASAKTIKPLLYSGEKFTSAPNAFRRANSWASNVYTKFMIEKDELKGIGKVYFAIKDISRKGQNAGTKWPWNKGDIRDSDSINIKRIAYDLKESRSPNKVKVFNVSELK